MDIEWKDPDKYTVKRIRDGIEANKEAENKKDEGMPEVTWIAPEDVDRLQLN